MKYVGILKEKGFKITPLRRRILEVFEKKHQTLTAEEMCRYIRKHIPQTGLQSVYRNLSEFVKAGIAEEIYRKRKSAYALCSEVLDHHHHVVCRKCGTSGEITDCDLNISGKQAGRLSKSLEASTGFRIEKHVVQLEGLCRDCKN